VSSGWTRWNGDQCLNEIVGALELGINDWLELVKTVSQTEVPLDEGTLLHSCYIKTNLSNTKVKGSISYGGGAGTGIPKVPYAIRWHFEDANFQHGRKKNYLKDPANNNASRLKDYCKSRIGGVL
jgi:hypothetical protein